MLLILLIAAGAILETLFIMQSYRRRDFACILFKALASACFVLLAAQCLRLRGLNNYGELVFCGLVCGVLGDVLLALRFPFAARVSQRTGRGQPSRPRAGRVDRLIALLGFRRLRHVTA